MTRGLELGVFVIALVCSGACAWWLLLHPVPTADASELSRLPRSINGWSSHDLGLDPEVANLLQADYNIQRMYTSPAEAVVFVYVGYYGTERGGAPEHTPDVCYPSQGWKITGSRDLDVGTDGDAFRVREFVVEQSGSIRLVHFWYRTESVSGFTSTTALRLRHVWSRIWNDRADGALVRVSTVVARDDEDAVAARRRILAFDVAVEAALDVHWPAEVTSARLPGTAKS